MSIEVIRVSRISRLQHQVDLGQGLGGSSVLWSLVLESTGDTINFVVFTTKLFLTLQTIEFGTHRAQKIVIYFSKQTQL